MAWERQKVQNDERLLHPPPNPGKMQNNKTAQLQFCATCCEERGRMTWSEVQSHRELFLAFEI